MYPLRNAAASAHKTIEDTSAGEDDGCQKTCKNSSSKIVAQGFTEKNKCKYRVV